MPRTCDPSTIESKWQKRWADAGVYATDLTKAKDPYYGLMMFPYPSGDRLHIGHWYSYAPADSYYRYMRMHGKDVFEPMGFDAFGLPAENHAVKTGVHPDASTRNNVDTMILQLKRMGCMFDWSKMVNTSTPEYYRWTQWLFLQMYRHKLAYHKEANVNFCPSCQTVLANEQAQDGTCERCGTTVVQKPLTQWFWKITQYAEKLLKNLDDLDWPEKTKTMQRNWIGRSEGVKFTEKVKDLDIKVEVFDTVPQTFLAQTFTVIAPEHPLAEKLIQGTSYEKPVQEFVEYIRKKKAGNRFNIQTDMEGIFTGRYIENPFGTGDLPIWIASYVVADYGTGIVNCSAHDERDFAFAKKYNIPLRLAMVPPDPELRRKVENFEVAYCKAPDGILIDPPEFAGKTWHHVRNEIIDYIEEEGFGTRTVHFRLRDWLVSRQRYWGAPIPIVYDPEGNPHPVPEEHLPWLLPTDVAFKPTGKSPLYYSKEFRKRTERIFGKGWTPEFDTMDTFVCSSFYYLMYLQSEGHGMKWNIENGTLRMNAVVDPHMEKTWMPVDCYIGGAEHACMHLIYARFVMMALKDFGFVSMEEPFKKLVHQGTITHNGAKMSKSRGNVVSPDTFVERHGSDVFRMYLMFMGPFTDGGDWSNAGIKGIGRFVFRLWRLFEEKLETDGRGEGRKGEKSTVLSQVVSSRLHATIKKVGEDIAQMHFNTAMSALMSLLNAMEKEESLPVDVAQTIAKLLAPLAPHLAEELWEMTGGAGFVVDQHWPAYDPKHLKSDTMTIVVQVNGKLRGSIEVGTSAKREEILALARSEQNVTKHIVGGVEKEIYVPEKLVNFVVG